MRIGYGKDEYEHTEMEIHLVRPGSDIGPLKWQPHALTITTTRLPSLVQLASQIYPQGLTPQLQGS